MNIFKKIKLSPSMFIDGFGTGKDNMSAKVSKGKSLAEKFDSVHGFVTVEVIRGNGEYELICKDKENLLTTSGRDFVHSNVYTATGTGTLSSSTTATRGCGFIGLTTDTAAAAAGDTTLAAEITTTGLQRADATTKTHSLGTNTTTIQNTFTATGTVTAVVKSGLFNHPTLGAATSFLVHENTFSSVTLNNNDTLQVTWTITAG